MIHYTCDRCKRPIDTETSPRYVAEVTIRSSRPVSSAEDVVDPFVDQAEAHELLEEEFDALSDLHQTLQSCDDTASLDHDLDEEIELSRRDRFDLCESCHREFLQSPLGREILSALESFSDN